MIRGHLDVNGQVTATKDGLKMIEFMNLDFKGMIPQRLINIMISFLNYS